MATIIDARTLDKTHTEIVCDICIIGAGAAGIYLAVRLAQAGLSVIIIEAGGRTCADGYPLDMIETGSSEYRGAVDGRAFGLGGTTARWGGLLATYTDLDIKETSEDFDPWRYIVNIVSQHSANVASRLGIGDWPDSACNRMPGITDQLSTAGIESRVAIYLPFRRKNFRSLLSQTSGIKGKLSVFINAVATSWEYAGENQQNTNMHAIIAHADSHLIKVCANSFVLAAGAIESTRMLLEIGEGSAIDPFHKNSSLGKYLSDHVSCAIADVLPTHRERAANLFAATFSGGHMRSARFMESSPPVCSPRYFAHFIFENSDPGFFMAKEILSAIQARKLPDVSASQIFEGMSGAMSLIWHRYVKSRLYVPLGTPAHFQLDVEQQPCSKNRITLEDKKDKYGRLKIKIEWGVQDEDYSAINAIASRFIVKWNRMQSGFPELISKTPTDPTTKPHDAYHPAGTCRMGIDSESVVDPELKVYGIHNLSVLSTAVFPTAGSANPTFSMLCLGDALADRLIDEWNKGA